LLVKQAYCFAWWMAVVNNRWKEAESVFALIPRPKQLQGMNTISAVDARLKEAIQQQEKQP